MMMTGKTVLSGNNDFQAWYDVIDRRARTLVDWSIELIFTRPPLGCKEHA